MLAMRGQILHFSKYVQGHQLGETLLRGLENASFSLVPYLDAMNRRHVVVELPSNLLFDFGMYISMKKGYQKAKARQGVIIIGVLSRRVVICSKRKW